MHERAGAITGAPAEALVEVLLQRPLANPPRRALLLNRWQAFATLWRQQWQPPEAEDRKVRWFAGSVSALWHLFFGGLLLWLMYVQYMAVRPPPPGEDVVQVEFIGTGTPGEIGGGSSPPKVSEAAAAAAESTDPAAATASRSAAARIPSDVASSLEAPLPDVVQREIPEPQLPAPSVQQPVTVSEPVPTETTVFVLPPTTPKLTEASPVAPDLVAPVKPIRALEVPTPVQPISRELPSRELSARAIESRISEVAAREVPAPVQPTAIPELTPRPIAPPQLSAAVPQVRTVDVPAPASATTAATSPSPARESSTTAAATTAPAATSPPRPGSTAPIATAGAGPKPVAAPGSQPTPTKADDWGDSTRNRPGGQRGVPGGVYNRDGSVRLAETPGSASPGLPPGTIEDRITSLDRAGTWLKRKPNDYEPTTFDQYWRPNETLLQEWVRKSITTVRIPIPGTNKHIVCKTVLLALGGGCGITDPNLNEQPARARPPPDIPFKPELQEDNGSVRPGG